MKALPAAILLQIVLLLTACTTAREKDSPINLSPQQEIPRGTAEGLPVQPVPDPEALRREQLASYPRTPGEREFQLRIFPQDARISILDGDELKALPLLRRENDRTVYSSDAGAVLLEAEGYTPLVLPLPGNGETTEAKMERPWELLRKIAEAPTEWQPKSVRFAPDGHSVFVANLGSPVALSQYSVDPPELIRNLQVPEEYREDKGFVETVILPERSEIWLSQMTTDSVHIFDTDSGEHKAVITLSGRWPKVLLANADESRVYVSCWESAMVAEIDVETRTEVRQLPTGAIPRGLTFSSDGTELLVALYGSSAVDRIDLKTGLRTARYDAAPGRQYAMRHIVHDRRRKEYYITAMGVSLVYRLSESGEWLGVWKVGEKPNTCTISPDGTRLFVSCRGPNNPDIGYLFPGYEFGRVYVINLDDSMVEGWIWGRDQPTGLDVSPDGRTLVFSDFLSSDLEFYSIQR